jgi:hypothetical protein
MPLVEPFDKNRTGTISVDNLCRALYQFPSARNVAKLVMNPKTHEIDYRQLRADLDSVQFSTPSDQCIRRRDHAIPDLIASFAGKVRSQGIILEGVFLRDQKTKLGLMNSEQFLRIPNALRVRMIDSESQAIVSILPFADRSKLLAESRLTSMPRSGA